MTWRRYCCLTSFFPIVDTCLSCKDIVRLSCAMVCRWRIFGNILHPVFSVSREQHVSDLHPKFTLRPHHAWKYGRHPICDSWDYARKKDRKKKKELLVHCYPSLLYRIAKLILIQHNKNITSVSSSVIRSSTTCSASIACIQKILLNYLQHQNLNYTKYWNYARKMHIAIQQN